MSYTVSNLFKAACAAGTKRLSLAVRIERLDGAVFLLTGHHDDVSLPQLVVGTRTVPAATYLSGYCAFPVNILESEDVSRVNNWELRVFRGGILTRDDLAKQLFVGATFSLILFFRHDVSLQMLLGRGTIGAQSLDRGEATWKMRGLSQALQGEVLDVTSPLSRATWGDGALDFFNLAGNTSDGFAARVTGAVSNVVDARRQFRIAATVGFPERRFESGVLFWNNGANAGAEAGEIMSWDAATGEVVLWHRTAYPVAVSDSVTARIKAPLTIEDWRIFFGSGRLFPGEPAIPTIEQANDVKEGS